MPPPEGKALWKTAHPPVESLGKTCGFLGNLNLSKNFCVCIEHFSGPLDSVAQKQLLGATAAFQQLQLGRGSLHLPTLNAGRRIGVSTQQHRSEGNPQLIQGSCLQKCPQKPPPTQQPHPFNAQAAQAGQPCRQIPIGSHPDILKAGSVLPNLGSLGSCPQPTGEGLAKKRQILRNIPAARADDRQGWGDRP